MIRKEKKEQENAEPSGLSMTQATVVSLSLDVVPRESVRQFFVFEEKVAVWRKEQTEDVTPKHIVSISISRLCGFRVTSFPFSDIETSDYRTEY